MAFRSWAALLDIGWEFLLLSRHGFEDHEEWQEGRLRQASAAASAEGRGGWRMRRIPESDLISFSLDRLPGVPVQAQKSNSSSLLFNAVKTRKGEIVFLPSTRRFIITHLKENETRNDII
ncbi:hypothetical protein ACLOJK_033594 [Asimina triloba]